MTIDCHLKLAGVDGESTHKSHKNEIELLTWHWDARQENKPSMSGGTGQGKGVPGLFTFTHYYDKSSPTLAKNCASGKHFDNGIVSVCKAGDGQLDFLMVTMKEVMVTSVAPGATSNGGITETVTLHYKDIEFEYKPQDAKGALSGSVKFGWDVATTEVR